MDAYLPPSHQHMTVAQGSVLSILFSIRINSIAGVLQDYTMGFLIDVTELHLQTCLRRLEQWAERNCFKFLSKTVHVL